MSESRSHMNLVQVVYEYMKKLVPSDKQVLIEVDSADTNRPKEIKGKFIPDVQFWDNDLFVIGEAKTLNDFERGHSRDQYDAYVKECTKFQGTSLLVVAVPWQLVITAKNYFKRMKCVNDNFKIIILNELGESFKV